MVATKYPYGSIHDDYVESLFFNKVYNKYYIIDRFGSRIEVEQNVYEDLKRKGVKELCK